MKKNYHAKEGIIGKRNIFFLIAILVIIIDRITKYLSLRYLTFEIDIIPGFFSLRFTTNTGAGFGILQGKTMLLSIISVLFIILIIAYHKQILKENYFWATALILGGAIANLFDRIFYGFVIDFLSISFWPIFNIADTAISIGAAALFIYLVKDTIKEMK